MLMPKSTMPKKTGPLLRTTVLAASSEAWDLYHRALRISWLSFFLLFFIAFLLINTVFGVLYMLGNQAISGAEQGSFADHFFFSVQTLATIGYGGMLPKTLYANMLVTLEAMIGLLGVGLFAALAFARLSLPRARIRFSNVAVVSNFDGIPTLMFRVANERLNTIIGARVKVNLLRTETTREGLKIRRYYDLKLTRSETPTLSLSWLILHPLVDESPLLKLTENQLQNEEFALLVTIMGVDETLSQTMHARHNYFNSDIRWNHRFVDIIHEADAGNRVVDLRLIDHTEQI